MTRCALLLTALAGMLLCGNAVKPSLRLNVNKRESCDCLGWADAFDKFGADCSGLGPNVCNLFLMKLPNEIHNFDGHNSTFCINEAPGGEWPNQWCYVSDECADGKEPAHGSARWKYCGEEEHLLKEVNFADLVARCQVLDLDIGLVAQWAYPGVKETEVPGYAGQPPNLNDVMAFFEVVPPEDHYADFGHENVNMFMEYALQDIVNSTQAIFIDSKTGLPPYGVIEGNNLYYINYSEDKMEALRSGEGFFDHPGKTNTVKCVSVFHGGCNGSRVDWGWSWWTELNG